jgi:hypothetical protein
MIEGVYLAEELSYPRVRYVGPDQLGTPEKIHPTESGSERSGVAIRMDEPVVPHPNVRPRARQLSKISESASRYAASSIVARKLPSFMLTLAGAR